MITETQIIEALKSVKYPGFSRDIISFGLVHDVNVTPQVISLKIILTANDSDIPQKIKASVEEKLLSLKTGHAIEISLTIKEPKQPPSSTGTPTPPTLPSCLKDVRYIIAIASGKGGVGKSTFSVNLACAFSQIIHNNQRLKIGLMDCDIYGPSTPLMIGVNQRPSITNNAIDPIENYGIRILSMGLLIDENAPVVWRGPMVTKTIQQFSTHVNWGPLDILVVDLPPGTGDAQLTLAQTLPLAGALIITTPQTAAVNVAARGAQMFFKVNVPIIGVAENMSFFEDPSTGKKERLFGEGGGTVVAEYLQTDLLGQVPLDPQIRIGCDRGIPIVIGNPDALAAKTFVSIAEKILSKLEKS